MVNGPILVCPFMECKTQFEGNMLIALNERIVAIEIKHTFMLNKQLRCMYVVQRYKDNVKIILRVGTL